MALLKKKIPALMQPRGQRMWTTRINPFDIHPCVNRDLIEVRIKKKMRKAFKQLFFERKNVSLGQFANDIDKAIMNPEKIDFFCSRLNICCEAQSEENKRLEREIEKIKNETEPLKQQIKTLNEDIQKVIAFLSKLDKTEAKKIIEELTKSTAQITV